MKMIKQSAGVVVAGGGLAGVCAAISAARQFRIAGKNDRVILINDRPVLGGVSSSEIRVPPIGAGRNPYGFETGIISELLYEERSRNHNRWEMGTANSIWDIVLWEAVKAEPSLDLFLNALVTKVNMDESDSNLINSIEFVQFGNEKQFQIEAEIFIDCTGDGLVAFEAGADYVMGRESSREYNENFAPIEKDDGHMGSSLLFQAKDMGFKCPFKRPDYAPKYEHEESLCFRPHQNFRNGYYWIEVGVPYDTIEDNETIRDELLKHVLGVWDHLKNHCNLFGKEIENWALDWVGMIPGKRGSRRILGDTIINENHLKNAESFFDEVGFGGHFFDLHTMGGILAADKPGNPVDTDPDLWDRCRLKPYPIPFGSLYSRNIKNLMMAGRNISSSHVANGSTRVMLTNALLGQAVGTASYICLSEKISPRTVRNEHIKVLQQSLLKDGCFLHHIRSEDQDDLVRSARISSTDSLIFELLPDQESSEMAYKNKLDKPMGTVFPVSGDSIETISLFLESKENEVVKLRLSIRALDHIWDLQNSGSNELLSQDILVPSNHKGELEIPLNMKTTPNKFYFVTVSETNKDVYWVFRRDHLPGCFSVWQSLTTGFWKYFRHKGVEGFELMCMDVYPKQKPFQDFQITSGISRPYDQTNCYISNKIPASLEFEWEFKKSITSIQLIFDTDLSRTNETMPAFYISPKCVKSYKVSFLNNENIWEEIIYISDNYQRLRRHDFHEILTSKMKVDILETHGANYASIYEIRIYGVRGS